MAYNYYPYQQNFPYQPMPQAGAYSGNIPVNAPVNNTVSTSTLVPCIFYQVPSEDVARNAYVELGKTVSFVNENAPYCYIKTAGNTPVDPSRFRKFRMVEETDDNSDKNSDFSNVSEKSIDIAECVQKSEFDAFKQEFDDVAKSVSKLRFDVDALGEKSTKKMVQKARKDADEE